MCRFWNRIVSLDDNRLPKVVLIWDQNLGYVNSWSSQVRELLNQLDMNVNYDNREQVSINSIWALLHELSCNNWKNVIASKPKLRTYVTFKKTFEVEPYVLSFMGRRRRSYLAQFRCGILPLQIEVGRWSNKNEEDRVCLVCNSGLVESENHFVFTCEHYNLERAEFFTSIKNSYPGFSDLPDIDKLQLFMTKECVQQFSKYLHNIFQMRQMKIFV